jgi:hypothetical protein
MPTACFLHLLHADWKTVETGELLSTSGSVAEVRWLNKELRDTLKARKPGGGSECSSTFTGVKYVAKYQFGSGSQQDHRRTTSSDQGDTTTSIRRCPPTVGGVTTMPLQTSIRILHSEYKDPPRDEARLLAPLAEISFDNASTAHLDSHTGNPALNKWAIERRGKWIPTHDLSDGVKSTAMSEALDKAYLHFLKKYSQPISLSGWPAGPRLVGTWTVTFTDSGDHTLEERHPIEHQMGEFASTEFRLKRYDLDRKVEVDILRGEGGKQNTVIVSDNAGGMSLTTLENVSACRCSLPCVIEAPVHCTVAILACLEAEC